VSNHDRSRRDGPAIVLIIAAADNDVIGRDGGLPWRLRSDLKHFRSLTIGKPVVMGRKTYLSLRRASDIMVIGGADIFAQALPEAARLELTRVHMRPNGDVTLPNFASAEWREVARREVAAGPGDDAPFTIVSFERAVGT
jgi:dihydrofolate reductase